MIQPIEKQSLVKALKRESFFSGDIFATAAAEIARLTSALTIAAGHVDSMSKKVDNADALAEAADNLFKIIAEAGLGYLARGLGVKSEPWFGRANDCMGDVKAALTDYQEGKAGKEPSND